MKLYEVESTESDINLNGAAAILRSFINFAKDELGLEDLPKFRFYTDSDFSVDNSSFGGYRDGVIYAMVVNRHINDILRSIAHEMVHYRQDSEGKIKQDSGETGSSIENEANYVAGIIMRKWGRRHPKSFALPSLK